jgi:hypothetical protein
MLPTFVVLGDPIAVIAHALGLSGEIKAVPQSGADVAIVRNERQI